MRVLLKLGLACVAAVLVHGVVTANVTYEVAFTLRCGLANLQDECALESLIVDYQMHYDLPLGVPAEVAAASVAMAEADAALLSAGAAAGPRPTTAPAAPAGQDELGDGAQHGPGGACCEPAVGSG